MNGWHSEQSVYDTGNPAVGESAGTVYLRGSLAGGEEGATAFILPVADRPAHDVYLPIYTFDGSAGAVEIYSNGDAYLHSVKDLDTAPKYASLAGLSFPAATSSAPPTDLSLVNGWQPVAASFNAGKPVVIKTTEGIVSLEGAVKGGNTLKPAFVLPAADRPAHVLNMPIFTFPGSYVEVGSVYIEPNGDVELYGPGASGLASLSGISFSAPSSPLKFTGLALINKWKNDATFKTGPVGVAKSTNGVVYLEGSVGGGTAVAAFVLPAGDRPAHNLYLPIFTSSGLVGTMYISSGGTAELYDGNATEQASIASVSFPFNG